MVENDSGSAAINDLRFWEELGIFNDVHRDFCAIMEIYKMELKSELSEYEAIDYVIP